MIKNKIPGGWGMFNIVVIKSVNAALKAPAKT